MIAHASSVGRFIPAATHTSAEEVRVPLRLRDLVRRNTARSWRVPGASAKRLGSSLGVHRTNAGRRCSGEAPISSLAHAAEEGLALGLAGISCAFMATRILITAVYPELLRMTIPELEAELQRANLAEFGPDAATDLEQGRQLAGLGDLAALRDASEAHAAKLVRIAAIAEILMAKRAGEVA